MKLLEKITEDEMVASFLKAEIKSPRFSSKIFEILKADGMGKEIINSPNIDSKKENKYRHSVLDRYRGFSKRILLFNKFPHNIEWKRVLLGKNEFRKIKFIKYDYWTTLSNGTRLPTEAAKNIKRGVEVFGEPNSGFYEVADVLEKGGKLPEIILVTADKSECLVALEGNLRLTAYALKPEKLPEKLEVLVGYSPKSVEWVFY